MTRKPTQLSNLPGAPITKLDNVPGPEASADELNKHYQRVRDVFACHRYDDVIAACHWCCDMEAGLAYSKPDEARGNRMFCSGRCASAHAAYRVHAHGRRKPKADTATGGIPPTTSKETATANKPEPEPGDDDGDDDNPSDEAEETNVTEKPDESAPSESPSTWKPKGQRPRKARKAKARTKKPERTDGKCAKGIHQMTEANRYEYKGTVWCRECRKASRAKSKNGNGKK